MGTAEDSTHRLIQGIATMSPHRNCFLRSLGIGLCLAAMLGLIAALPRSAADEPSAGSLSQPGKQEAAKGFEVQIARDVVYRDLASGENAKKGKNKLDLYLPAGAKDYPVLLFVHGGLWMRGDKNQRKIYSTFASNWARHGVGTVMINYRLSPEVKHPAHIKDVAKAFAWTYKNIAKYGGRADQIFISGHSAGGHLAALLATDPTYLQAEGLSPQRIRGVIPISGVFRIHDEHLEAGLDSHSKSSLPNTLKARLNLVNSVFGADPRIRKEASPLTHVRPGLPPFLILYAHSDLPLLPEMAREFELALKKCKCDAPTMEIKDRTHMSILLKADREEDPVFEAMRTFIDQYTGMDRAAGGNAGKP
jgi:acetyl esterase/lipase